MKSDADWDGAFRRRDPRELRRLLSLPIRINKIRSKKRREKIERDGIANRERALFVLRHIPDDWPELIRWQLLAWHLAGELFAGCRVIGRGLGGPSVKWQRHIAEHRASLFRQFEAYHANHPHMSRQQAAGEFIKKNSNDCGHPLVDVRKFFTDDDGCLVPTKKGLAIAIARLPDLARASAKAVHKARELGLLGEVSHE
jgi:hypothetical protein